jgi:Zn finger protein HypA/HybF involved in hydrogenase expression
MAKPPKNLWKRIVHHFRAPTFEELLEESSESLDNQPVQMNCPRCGETVPFTDNCPNCGSPRYPTIDQGV